MNSYTRFIIFLVALLPLGLLAGCSDSKSTQQTFKGVIKIGANLEMTGTNASFGLSAMQGAKLAIKQINENGGVLDHQKLELVVVDNKSEVAESTNVMQKLLSNDKLAAVIAPIASSSAIAGADMNQKYKILGISPTASNPAVTVDPATGKVREYMFRATFIDPFQGSVMAVFAKERLKAKTAAVYIESSSEYAKGLGHFFAEKFVQDGGKILLQANYLQKDTDFRTQLQRIKAANPDVLFIPGYYQEVGMIIKQARDMGINIPILGGDGWDSARLPDIAGRDALNNVFFTNHYSPDDSSAAVKQFVADYKKEYGKVPDAFAALSYDATKMIANAITTAGSPDPIKVCAAMAKTKKLEVVSGSITLNDTHDPIKSAVIVEFKDGQQAFKEKVNP